MGKKKVVLDTNVLISAFGWKGKQRIIFEKILNREFELIISQKQLIELYEVLSYPKFNFKEEQKLRFMGIIYSVATIVNTFRNIKVIQEDPSDNVILESAVITKADFLISGDEHLLKIKEFDNTKIVTASEFLDLGHEFLRI